MQKILIYIGLIILVIGLLWPFLKELPIGRMPGDIVLKKYKAVINVNGCFWHHHNCGNYKIPKNNRKFWLKKFKNNKKRDRINSLKIKKLGWKVYKIWECNIEKRIKLIVSKL